MELDLDAYYTVDGYDNRIAFYLEGYVMRIEPVDGDFESLDGFHEIDYDEFPDTDWVRAIMVGDDRVHEIEVTDLTLIEDEDSICSCGQLGCCS